MPDQGRPFPKVCQKVAEAEGEPSACGVNKYLFELSKAYGCGNMKNLSFDVAEIDSDKHEGYRKERDYVLDEDLHVSPFTYWGGN